MLFISFLSAGFTTVAVINPPDWKLANRTSVQWVRTILVTKYHYRQGQTMQNQLKFNWSKPINLNAKINILHQSMRGKSCINVYFVTIILLIELVWENTFVQCLRKTNHNWKTIKTPFMRKKQDTSNLFVITHLWVILNWKIILNQSMRERSYIIVHLTAKVFL